MKCMQWVDWEMVLAQAQTVCIEKFLIACYATLHPTMPVGWSVGRSVGWSVGPLFGQRPQWGRCPVELRGTFVRSTVRTYMRPPPPRGSNLSLKAQIPPQGSIPSLQAQIPASRRKSRPPGSNSSPKAQIPPSRHKSLPQILDILDL